MMSKQNVPELRFPEFSGEWIEAPAKELFSSVSDKKHDGNLEVLSASQSKGMIKRNDIDIDIKFDKGNLKNYKRTRPGDFIISLRSFQGGFELNNLEGLVSPAYTVLRLNQRNTDKKFFKQYFKMPRFIKRLDSMIYGIRDGKSISYKEFSTFKLRYPEFEEQKKIGEFFSKLDRLIKLEEKKLELLEEQKKGYMQKIFSQELRFKDESGNDYPEWGETQLSNLITEVVEKTTSSNQYELISSTKNGLYKQAEYFKKQVASKDNKGYKIIRLNNIIISPQNLWLGNINFNDKYEVGIVSPSYRTFKVENISSFHFLKHLLKTKRYLYEYEQASEQGASIVRRNLNMDLFYDISVKIPVKEERIKIGSLLDQMDKRIDSQQKKLDILNERKKSLLKKMFV